MEFGFAEPPLQSAHVVNKKLYFDFLVRSHGVNSGISSDRIEKLGERWQLNQIVRGDGFYFVSCLAPCGQSSHDDERVESLLPQ
jgi:hypothetical protein